MEQITDIMSVPSIIVLYAGMNIVAFLFFTGDKLGAKAGMARSPENLLLFLAALGPFGAIAAMALFRHKTRHLKFLLVPGFLLVHVLLMIWSGILPYR